MPASLSAHAHRVAKAGVDGLIATPVIGSHVYDALFKRSLRRSRRDLLHTPEELRKVFTEVITDLRSTVDGPLTYFEAGVYAGQSLALWHQVADELGVVTRSFGADSFQGLPDSVLDDEGGWRPGLFRCSRKVTEWNLRRIGAPRDRITLIEGWFDQSLSPELGRQVGVVHAAMIDGDAYSSTVPVLRFLGPLLANPSHLIFDDWFSGDNYDPDTGLSRGRGEERAFDEWLAANSGWQVELVADYDLLKDGRTWPVGHAVKLTRT